MATRKQKCWWMIRYVEFGTDKVWGTAWRDRWAAEVEQRRLTIEFPDIRWRLQPCVPPAPRRRANTKEGR